MPVNYYNNEESLLESEFDTSLNGSALYFYTPSSIALFYGC